MFENVWLLGLGLVAGIVGSIVGLGGGIVTVPVLTFIGVPHTLASSSSLFAAFSNSIASTASYARQKRVDYKNGLRLGLMSVPGTILGAILSGSATSEMFKILFAVVLGGSCYYMFMKRNLEPKQKIMSAKIVAFSMGVSFFAGVLSSFFGIGGGVVFVPLMIVGLGILVKNATATSQLILMFSSASGMVAHVLLGHADFEYAVFLAIGAFVGGLIGARLSLEIKENKLRLIIIAVILAAAAKLILDALGI